MARRLENIRDRRREASLIAVASTVALVRTRQKLGLPRPASTLLAFAAPPALAAGFARSRSRDGLVWGAHMWSYKNAFEIPHDAEEEHRDRTHVDYPIVIDKLIGAGVPPGQRLQRRLRRRGELTWLDKAMSFFYWTWEAEPHLVILWLRWQRPKSFAAAAGRLAATFDLTLLGYWALPVRHLGGPRRRWDGWTATCAGSWPKWRRGSSASRTRPRAITRWAATRSRPCPQITSPPRR